MVEPNRHGPAPELGEVDGVVDEEGAPVGAEAAMGAMRTLHIGRWGPRLSHQVCELLWAAGFWDGEGTAWTAADRIFLGIGQCDREVLDRFHAAVGVGNVTGPYFRNGNAAEARDGYKRRPMFKWQVSGVKARELATRLRPLVGTAKREQFNRVAA